MYLIFTTYIIPLTARSKYKKLCNFLIIFKKLRVLRINSRICFRNMDYFRNYGIFMILITEESVAVKMEDIITQLGTCMA